ncbi:UTP-GlnB uridylyltransferase, GlnD [Geobacter metallireducens RCH3]|uniref:Bifunctional uridylyltransferase/uridylyl-removing enzyme n=1 Tax=Geobacter metallireducens (strain ATCC 53774 / DSM 7210 / GS-15) TaxID=269799 RepID=Q39VR4_GEOMG|nr:[protein-PII] uridylyltransferase [Geobacter metallireducens]ABB31660.1 nitrogen regulatory protein P-II uridylyltransferase, GlnD [Geobacter metallireducens GS-15]EHP89463.1 UTP-GlnB uridylyltransferase, GlnD [Geobacter metallireducens RCH3]
MEFNIDRYFPDTSQETGDAGRASFEEKRPLYLAASKHFLNHYREEIREMHNAGTQGSVVVRNLTAMTDTLVRKLFRSITRDVAQRGRVREPLTLTAIGGYGRGELNPYSDIDLMFLYGGKDQARVEDIAQKLLYFLWDMRLDVGYSVRTLQDCVEMAASDLTVRTALLDARVLAGSRLLFKDFEKVMLTQILSKRSDSFIKEKVAELGKRREKYGSSVYLLEPNVKESEGGLRDLHTALWVAKIKYKISDIRELIVKGVMTEEEVSVYGEALSYLWRIRNELHFHAGRKNDQLTFDAQINLAGFFGYKDVGKSLAVEEFMRDYYLHATRVEHLSSSLITKCSQREERALKIIGYFVRRHVGEGFYIIKGELVIPDESVIHKEPARLMKIFEYAQKHGVAISVTVKSLIRKNLHLINDKFRRNKDVNQSFFAILRSEKGASETLQLMHHLEFLNRFIPEFGNIYCKVQHDLYHIYTVDTHSLFAVEEIEKLLRGDHAEDLPLLTRLAREVDKRELLILGVLFHDIGKGEGGGHADKGADMIPTIARRMGLCKEDSERLEFMVRSHLLMAHIAQRRDLHDDKMIIQFARQMEKSENLKMLYLLSYADIRAVGTDVWTEWKAMLLQELYEKSFNVLERGDFRLEARSERVKKVKRNVLELLGDEYPVAAVKEELKAMTNRHLLSNAPQVIAEHVKLLLALEHEKIITRLDHESDGGYSNFTICTLDVPGLFSMITGVMAANGINILGAQIHTSSNGKALDILQVNSPQGFIITDVGRWKRVNEDLRQVLTGKTPVASLVAKRQRPTLLAEKAKPRFSARVEIDNEVSSDYTVIDIYTHDKVGILYQITSTLTELGLYIGVSKISTKVDQVADVFYVKDIFGHKITNPERLEEIRERLLKAVE